MLAGALTLLAGLLVGLTLTSINLLTALKAGLWDTGQLTAGFLSSVLHARARDDRLRRGVLAATLAASMGAMPATLGLAAAFPAATLLGAPPALLDVVVLGALLGLFGLALAATLEGPLFDVEQLRFPSGAATAELMASFEAGGPQQAMTRPFFVVAAAAALVTLLRDVVPWLPQSLEVSVPLGAAPLALGLAVSPMLLGTGSLIGGRLGASLAAGALVAWGGVARWAPTPEGAGEWLRWSGAALLVGASLPATARTLRQLTLPSGGARGTLPLLVAALLVALDAWWRFGASPLSVLAGLVMATLLGTVAARVAGATDVAPLGDLAQLSLAAGAPGGQASALLVGQLTAGSGAQVTGALWNRRIGRNLGVTAREQWGMQALGVVAGALTAGLAFGWLTRGRQLGSSDLPAPSAAQWVALSRVLTKGLDAVPPGTLAWVGAAGLTGWVLAMLERPARRWLPAPVGLGLAFLLPAPLSLTLAGGALLGGVLARRRGELVATAVGAGLLAGEALPSVAWAALSALG